MRVSVLFAVAAVLLCTMQGAFASVATTTQTWTFATEAGSSTASSVTNAYGLPSAVINVDVWGTGWYNVDPPYGLAQGWWDIGLGPIGSIVLTIPNRPTTDPNSYKDITIWVKYWNQMTAAPTVQVSPTATFVSKTSQLVAYGTYGAAWWADTWTFHIVPNPNSETITILGDSQAGSQIDEIRVDTSCTATAVPEPGTILAALSILGPAGFLFRRKRA